MLIPTWHCGECSKTCPHSACNISPDLMLEDTADTLSGGQFMLRHGVLGNLTAHWQRRYGPTLSHWTVLGLQLSCPFHHPVFYLILQWSCNDCHQPNKSNVKDFLEETWHWTLEGEMRSQQGMSKGYVIIWPYMWWSICNVDIGIFVLKNTQLMKFQLLSSIIELGIAMGKWVNTRKTAIPEVCNFFPLFCFVVFILKKKVVQEKNIMPLPTNSGRSLTLVISFYTRISIK